MSHLTTEQLEVLTARINARLAEFGNLAQYMPDISRGVVRLAHDVIDEWWQEQDEAVVQEYANARKAAYGQGYAAGHNGQMSDLYVAGIERGKAMVCESNGNKTSQLGIDHFAEHGVTGEPEDDEEGERAEREREEEEELNENWLGSEEGRAAIRAAINEAFDELVRALRGEQSPADDAPQNNAQKYSAPEGDTAQKHSSPEGDTAPDKPVGRATNGTDGLDAALMASGPSQTSNKPRTIAEIESGLDDDGLDDDGLDDDGLDDDGLDDMPERRDKGKSGLSLARRAKLEARELAAKAVERERQRQVTLDQFKTEIRRIAMGKQMPTMQQFDESKPAVWPTAGALVLRHHTSWSALAEELGLNVMHGRRPQSA